MKKNIVFVIAFGFSFLFAADTLSYEEKALTEGLLSMVLASPEYKGAFNTECVGELLPYFGAKQADASCDCAYQKLLMNNNGMMILSWMNGDSKGLNDSLVAELFIPCIPEHYTQEMEMMLLDTCGKSAPRSVCSCVLNEIERSMTVKQLVFKAFNDQSFLSNFVTGLFFKCQDK